MEHPDSLQSRLYEQVQQSPDRRALTFYDPKEDVSWLSIEALYGQAQRTAEHLTRHGLQRGDVCVIVLPSDAFAAKLVLAVLLVGGVPIFVAPPTVQGSLLDLPRILKHTVRKTQARLVICDVTMAERREQLEHAVADTRFLFGEDELAGEEPSPGPRPSTPPVFPAADDVAAMQLTSGTTGFPRVCVWSQERVLAALDGMAAAMQLADTDICFNWTPLYHDMGLVNNFLLCLTSGTPLVLFSPHEFVKRPALWLRGLHDTQATITWSPNFGYAVAAQRVRDRQLEGVRLDHVRAFWNAAERIHYDTIQSFYERFKPYGLSYGALKTNFGCAENVGGATFSDVNGTVVVEHVDRKRLHEDRIAHPVSGARGSAASDESPSGGRAANGEADREDVVDIVSAGRPHPDLQIQILSGDTGETLPDGHVGEIALDSPSRMLGYLDDPEATEQALDGGLLRTGDLGYLRNNELFWVGRVKERITVRGKKLDPSDFEPVLFDIDGLREGCFVVFGVDDEAHGTQRIVVISEVREPLTRGTSEIEADIYKQVFLRLGVTVNEIVFVRPGTLAKTSSGKRRHRHFRRLYVAGELQSYVIDAEASPADSLSTS
jgi:fatty-acyl-CoA synthase